MKLSVGISTSEQQSYIFHSIAKQIAQCCSADTACSDSPCGTETSAKLLLIWNKLISTLFPALGGRTPSYGYMTPSHDPSQTPLHGGSAWDPTISNTPARYVSMQSHVL